jgi:6-phosphofructokinase 1
LARHHDDDGPHVICFPERPVNEDELMLRIESVYRRLGRVVIVSCEGQMNDRRQPFGADVDRAGSELHRLASNLGHSLAKLITSRTGLRARAEKPGLFGRSCAAFASETDRNEAYECGRAAVRAAAKDQSGVMVALRREDGPEYRCSTTLVALETVARRERPLPSEWIGDFDVMPQFLDYVRPLAGAIEPHARLAVNSTNDSAGH